MTAPLLVLTAVLLAGCGQDASPQVRDALQGHVGAVVVAANAGDGAVTRTALAALRADVEDAQRLGSLSVERATELTRLADAVEAALPAQPSPAPAATRAPAVPRPTAEPERGGEREGKGRGDEKDEKDD